MTTPKKFAAILSIASLCAVLGACASDQGGSMSDHHHDMNAMVDDAVAIMEPTSGSSVHGIVKLHQMDGGVAMDIDIIGVDPADADHGFHIHELGDLSKSDGTSAGGHYDPMGTHQHGGPESPMHHAGDLGNVHADAQGHIMTHVMATGVSLSGPHSILGRSLVLHKAADDLKTNPAGNAGARIGVGVIGIAAKPAPATAPK